MIFSIKGQDLEKYIYSQLCSFFPDTPQLKLTHLSSSINMALERTEYCFKRVQNKYYINEDGDATFNHLNGDQYAMFLYFLSNTLWNEYRNIDLATRVFSLNKALHGVDLFYEVNMPDIFLLVHPLGTVLGRASYSDYFVAYQGCTVGKLADGGYPVIGEHVTMYSNSSLLGDCVIGSNVILGSNSYLINSSVGSNKVVVGQYPNERILINKLERNGLF